MPRTEIDRAALRPTPRQKQLLVWVPPASTHRDPLPRCSGAKESIGWIGVIGISHTPPSTPFVHSLLVHSLLVHSLLVHSLLAALSDVVAAADRRFRRDT